MLSLNRVNARPTAWMSVDRSLVGLLATLVSIGCGGAKPSPEDIFLSESDGDTTEADDSMPDLEPAELCSPSGGGPHWLKETETVEFVVSCSTGHLLDVDAFSFPLLPEGASYDALTGTFSWTPSLSQAAVYELQIMVEGLTESGTVKIGVADAFDDPSNLPIVDATTYTEEYGLPVLHLDSSPELTNEFYTPATITYRGHVYTAKSKLRGVSSLGYPKNSYTLKFAKKDKFSDPEVLDGFIEKRKIVATTTFDDNSYIRQRLAFELWNRLDPQHIQVQAYNAIIFLDGEYWGLYMIGDHIDGYLMEDHGLDQDGNLFKARTHDANFRNVDVDGNPKVNLYQGLSKSEGFPEEGEPGAFDDLIDFVDFVANAPSEQFLAELATRVRVRDYENWWIFVTAISAGDSAGKNSYHYHDPAGGPWRFIPWDFNHSFGQDWRTIRIDTSEHPEKHYLRHNELFARFMAETSIGPALKTRYLSELSGPYAIESILETIDAWTHENHLSALRDQSRWGEDYLNYGGSKKTRGWSDRSDFLDHDQEVAYLRQWVVDRWLFLEKVLSG